MPLILGEDIKFLLIPTYSKNIVFLKIIFSPTEQEGLLVENILSMATEFNKLNDKFSIPII